MNLDESYIYRKEVDWSATARPDVFVVESITRSELYEASSVLVGVSEEEFERFDYFARRDESASIVTRPQLDQEDGYIPYREPRRGHQALNA